MGAISFKYDDSVTNYNETDYMNDATFYIWSDMVNTVDYLKSIGKLSAFSNHSNTGKIEYVTVTPLDGKIAEDSALTALSVVDSDSAPPKNFWAYQG